MSTLLSLLSSLLWKKEMKEAKSQGFPFSLKYHLQPSSLVQMPKPGCTPQHGLHSIAYIARASTAFELTCKDTELKSCHCSVNKPSTTRHQQYLPCSSMAFPSRSLSAVVSRKFGTYFYFPLFFATYEIQP